METISFLQTQLQFPISADAKFALFTYFIIHTLFTLFTKFFFIFLAFKNVTTNDSPTVSI